MKKTFTVIGGVLLCALILLGASMFNEIMAIIWLQVVDVLLYAWNKLFYIIAAGFAVLCVYKLITAMVHAIKKKALSK